jgi:4-diphosphocytidyl-2-C-methyl-D-erythritol kinase
VAEPLVLAAPAKLNLDLLVLGRRSDGYHELDSLVVFTDLADRLTLEPASELTLEVTGPFAAELPEPETNLVLRAARRLAEAGGVRAGARLRLEKHIPVAAGLGGGSTDAAAALRGLAHLWGLPLTEPELRALALPLGADLPVCLYAQPARVRGLGERLDPVRGLPELPLVLVNPRRPVPTAAVFAGLDPAQPRPLCAGDLPSHPSLAQFAAWLARSRNDLEPPATALEPVIADMLAGLRAQPECLVARMSGSGATCFGLFPDRAAAARAADALSRGQRAWWLRETCAPFGAWRSAAGPARC